MALGAPSIPPMNDSQIIDKLGGTTAVANFFGIKTPSVCEWRKVGIPKDRRQTLAMAYPEVCPKDWLPPGVSKTS